MQKSKLQSMGRWGETEGAPGENERGVGPAPAGLCVAVVDSWSCAGGLPSVAGDSPCPAASAAAKEKGSPSDDPYGPTNGGEERPGGRREVGGGGTGVRQIPTLFLAADLCSRVGPACCFPRPPALLSRARFLPSSRPRASLLASRAFSTA